MGDTTRRMPDGTLVHIHTYNRPAPSGKTASFTEGQKVGTRHGPATVTKVLRSRVQVRYDTPRQSRNGAVEVETLPAKSLTRKV